MEKNKIKICLICKKEFEYNSNHLIYCSVTCSYIATLQRSKERYKEHKQELLLYMKKYRQENIERIRNQSKDRYQKNKKRILERAKKYRKNCVICNGEFKTNRRKEKTCSKECLKRLNNKIRKKWRKENRERIAEMGRKWRKKNSDRIKLTCQAYRKTHPWLNSYSGARQRCLNPKSVGYSWYGGRGIKFRINSYGFKYLWFRDKAYLMKQASIDRINNNGNYILKNCRFIELSENVKKALRERDGKTWKRIK